MMRQEKKSNGIKGQVRVAALGCALVLSFAGLVACSRDRQSPPATATVPVTVTEVLRVDVPPSVGQTATFSSTELGVTLQYPAGWLPGNPDVHTYSGEDGFFTVSAAGLVEPSASVMCEAEMHANMKKENRYGQRPTLDILQIDNQPACLIMPSDDQPETERGLALLVVEYPDAVARLRAKQAVIVSLFADKRHIRGLGASLKFTGPRRQWTPDPSTPAAPVRDQKHFVSDYGVSFDYPANWFTVTLNPNMVMVQNAPPDGIAALKPGDGFRAIAVELKPEDTTGYTSTQAYVDATLLQRLPKENVLSVVTLPLLQQGYAAIRVTYQGEGETEILFATNGKHTVQLSTTYVPGKRSEAKYLEVLDQIAATLVIP